QTPITPLVPPLAGSFDFISCANNFELCGVARPQEAGCGDNPFEDLTELSGAKSELEQEPLGPASSTLPLEKTTPPTPPPTTK
ncbi:hypothetical protein AAF712_016079, partial [Marasmius tenuissimus]